MTYYCVRSFGYQNFGKVWGLIVLIAAAVSMIQVRTS
jgi:hypothetical protein